MTEPVGRDPQYEVFAEEFLEHARDGFFNAHWDRPACLELLGDMAGKRVLDAGCGPGLYAEIMLQRGASVVGFDHSPRMIELARKRAPAADLRVHDFGDPLEWIADASIDVVLCALAIDSVDDRVAVLREFRRVLKPGGSVVVSRMHPTSDWLRTGGSYFETRVVQETWKDGWTVRFWIAPLQQTCAEFADAGFLIERLLEPVPDAGAAAIDRGRYERGQREPGFIAFRLVPR